MNIAQAVDRRMSAAPLCGPIVRRSMALERCELSTGVEGRTWANLRIARSACRHTRLRLNRSSEFRINVLDWEAPPMQCHLICGPYPCWKKTSCSEKAIRPSRVGLSCWCKAIVTSLLMTFSLTQILQDSAEVYPAVAQAHMILHFADEL